MRDSDRTLHLVKEMMRARQQEAATAAIRSRHSRSGLLSRFLRDMADRLDARGRAQPEL